MKKKKAKQLRKIANEMPNIEIVRRTESERAYGRELIAQGVTKLRDGKDVNPDEIYNKHTPVIQQANHYRTMKKLLTSKGVRAAGNYYHAVNQYAAQRSMAQVQSPPEQPPHP